MPELPEVETIVKGLRERLLGKLISEIYPLKNLALKSRSLTDIYHLCGAKIVDINRRGKYIIFLLSEDEALLFHLGMTGQLLLMKSLPSSLQKHIHLMIKFYNKEEVLYFRDPRRFGLVDLIPANLLSSYHSLSQLGPEPFQISLNEFKKQLKSRKGRVKSVLLNQRVIAGIGNIYADEILFKAKLNPLRTISSFSDNDLERLFIAIKDILSAAISNGGSSISDYLNPEGKTGIYQDLHKVYNRAGKNCFVCGEIIKRVKINQRSSYYCPFCQPITPNY